MKRIEKELQLPGRQEVTGSTPVFSTFKPVNIMLIGFFNFG